MPAPACLVSVALLEKAFRAAGKDGTEEEFYEALGRVVPRCRLPIGVTGKG
jgi:hypothetical protein